MSAHMYQITVHKSLAKPERLRVHAALTELGGVPFFDPDDSGPEKTGFVFDRASTESELKVRDAVKGAIGQDTQVEVRKQR